MNNQLLYISCDYGKIVISPDDKGNVVISQKRTNGTYGEIILRADEMERLAKGIFKKRRDLLPTPLKPLPQPSPKSSSPKAYTIEQKRKEQGKGAYKSWTKEDDEKLKELYAKGVSETELADFFQRGTGAIRSRISKIIGQ